ETAVTATTSTQGAPHDEVGAPPPFDPELLPFLDALAAAGRPPFTRANIPLIRQAPPLVPPPTDEDLRRLGTYELGTVFAEGPAGAPQVPLLVLRPAAAVTPVACLYYIHG